MHLQMQIVKLRVKFAAKQQHEKTGGASFFRKGALLY